MVDNRKIAVKYYMRLRTARICEHGDEQWIYQPINTFIKLQFMTSTNILHVSAPVCHPLGVLQIKRNTSPRPYIGKHRPHWSDYSTKILKYIKLINIKLHFFLSHSYRAASWYYQSFSYSPTDAPVSCPKKTISLSNFTPNSRQNSSDIFPCYSYTVIRERTDCAYWSYS